MSAVPARAGRVGTIAGELAKLPAFVRRDVRVMLSYRVAFISDVVNLLLQGVLFALVSGMIDERTLPQFGAGGTSYLEFVTIGIAVAAFVGVGVGRVSAVLRSEQVMGTLESLVATPTSNSTIQLGSVAFDLLYVPLRLGCSPPSWPWASACPSMRAASCRRCSCSRPSCPLYGGSA